MWIIRYIARHLVYLNNGVPAELIVYPGVGRGFDFRMQSRTFADDLATKDANQRTADFISKHLQ
jgi:carboxymethylenebutenolidase